MKVMKSASEDRRGFMANSLGMEFMRQVVASAELKERGSGGDVMAAALGGVVEAAYQLSGMEPSQFRRFLTDNIGAYCDYIDPPKEVEGDD